MYCGVTGIYKHAEWLICTVVVITLSLHVPCMQLYINCM